MRSSRSSSTRARRARRFTVRSCRRSRRHASGKPCGLMPRVRTIRSVRLAIVWFSAGVTDWASRRPHHGRTVHAHRREHHDVAAGCDPPARSHDDVSEADTGPGPTLRSRPHRSDRCGSGLLIAECWSGPSACWRGYELGNVPRSHSGPARGHHCEPLLHGHLHYLVRRRIRVLDTLLSRRPVHCRSDGRCVFGCPPCVLCPRHAPTPTQGMPGRLRCTHSSA